jgi:hypothetical protein
MVRHLELFLSASTTLNMLHGTLLDTYRRYKANTDRVIRWLVENSEHKVKGTLSANVLPELAAKVPSERNSEDVLRILDQVIQARTECATQYKYKVNHQASTEKHEHFIRILKEVQRSLRQSLPAKATYHSRCPDTDTRTLNNRFELLELQEPLEWDDHAAETPLKEQVSVVEDDIFAHFCFLLDFHRIRKQVRWTWEQYRDKKISATVAGLTTNVAFDNITKLHDELVAVFPMYSSYESLEQILLDDAKPTKTNSSPIRTIPEPLPGHEAYNVLSHYLQGYERGVFTDFHPEDDQYELTSSTPDSHDIIKTLARNIPDILCFVLENGGANGPIDELSCLLQTFYQSHKLTVPLVFACKIFVDINLILLDDVQRAYHELKALALRAEIELKKLDLYHKLLKADCSIPITRQTLESTRSFIGVIVKDDAVAKFRAAHVKPARATAPFYMLKHHPILCGLLQFHLDRTLSYVGLRLCNEWECCIGVLHLYNAVKPQVSSWTDSETMINTYSESHLFKGRAPTKPKEQLKKFKLAAGVPSSSTRYTHRRPQEAIGTVLFFVKQPLLDVMRRRYSVQDGKRESIMVLQDIEDMLKSNHDSPWTSLKTRALRQWKSQKRLDPVDMLALVTEGVQQEEFQLNFDFMSFNRRCIELLRRLWERLVGAVTDVHWPVHLLENQALCASALFVLEELGRESNSSARYRQIVEHLFQETILREGDKETEGARLRLSGKK